MKVASLIEINRPLPPPYHATPSLVTDSQGSVCKVEDAIGLATDLMNKD